MSIEVEEKHPDILVWLKAIKEANDANKNPIDYFQDKLFKGSKKPAQFIRNILNELQINGFLTQNYTVNEKGINALKDGIIFLPQEGIYEISVINDPLFSQVIVDFDELNPDLHAELSSGSKENSYIERNIDLPKFIFKVWNFGKIQTLNTKDRKSIIVSKIVPKGNKVKEVKQTNLKLEIDDNYNLRLKLLYKNEFYNLFSPISDPNKIIEQILIRISKNADLDLHQIPVSYDEISVKERKSFQMDFNISKLVLNELYEFDYGSIEQVAIFPKDRLSATKWVHDLLLNLINTYITSKELDKIWNDVCKNPAFNNYDLEKVEKKQLLENILFASEKYWFLMAPEDLNLERGLLYD
ncbi:MAG TPA: hypothetical protein VMX55_10285 [candidate division Zixibacteria bacterium]|nr:hypothetical protein [candidate division Zixibacteria bacterium]